MAIKIGSNLIDLTIKSVTSEATSYPGDNMAKRGHLFQPWRSTDTTEQKIVINFETSLSIPCIFLDGCNFTSATIETNGNDSWSSPTDSQAVTISQDKLNRRYKVWHEPSSSADSFIRIVIGSQTPTNGASYFTIGRVVVPQTVTEVSQNIQYGYSRRADRPKKYNEFTSGPDETIHLGDHLKWQGKLSWGFFNDSSMDDLYDLNDIMEDGLFLFFENRSDSSKTYLAKKVGQIDMELFSYEANRTNSFTLREHI